MMKTIVQSLLILVSLYVDNPSLLLQNPLCANSFSKMNFTSVIK
jgi:hypothetical protein